MVLEKILSIIFDINSFLLRSALNPKALYIRGLRSATSYLEFLAF